MIYPTSAGRPRAYTHLSLKGTHTHIRTLEVRHPIFNITMKTLSFPGKVRKFSYNLFFSVQLVSYL